MRYNTYQGNLDPATTTTYILDISPQYKSIANIENLEQMIPER
jgi:hypothetical protein